MKNTENTSLGSAFVTAIALFGGYILNTLYIAFSYLGKGTSSFFKMLWNASRRFRHWAASLLKKLGRNILSLGYKISHAVKRPFKVIKEEKEHNGGKVSFKTAASVAGKVLFGKNGVFVTVFNIVVPAVSVFFLFSVITYSSSLTYAVKLTVNGQFLGYIENEQVFLDAQEVLQDRISYLGRDIDIEAVPSYSIEKIGYSDTLNKYQIVDLILRNSGVNLDYGYGFYINDTFYGALMDFTKVKETLESLLEEYKTDNESEVIAFVDEIRFDEPGLYLSDSFIDEDWLIGLLKGKRQEAMYYEVEYGDSHLLIADYLGKSMSELELMNPGFTDRDLHVGDKIKYSEEVPFLSVSITRTEVYNVESNYSTETYNDNTIYEGSSRKMREGEYGENRVTADVTYVNGKETNRTVKQVTVVKEPVSELIAIGTRPTPAGTFKNDTAAYGKLLWPVNGGYISQWTHWDGGYYGHEGIDIAGVNYGDPVYAGASGVVTYAGWYYGLGNYVEIYHPDLGISSGYAHNSSIYVSVGQQVSQGECISAAGATGVAYGVHVHLAVKVSGVNVNPRPYLDYSGHSINIF